MSMGTRERRTQRSATSRRSWPSRTTLTGGVGSDSENTSVAAGGAEPRPDPPRAGWGGGEKRAGRGGRGGAAPPPAEVGLVGDGAGPGEELAVVEDRLVDDDVVLM